MRASIYKDDPGYVNVRLCYGASVFLDGVERTRVVTADEERRFIVRYKTNEAGKIVPTEDGTELQTETLYGDVRIERLEIMLVHAHHRQAHQGQEASSDTRITLHYAPTVRAL